MDVQATVVFDDDCGFCRWSAERLRTWDRRHALRFVTLRSDEAGRLLAPVPVERRPLSWHLVTEDGRVWSAGAAVPQVLRLMPGGGPLSVVTAVVPDLTETVYTMIARHRSTLGRLLGRRACSVDPTRGSAVSPDGADT
jgi:predicted DCC family thiol-disulfide oxidoreductase YuxK